MPNPTPTPTQAVQDNDAYYQSILHTLIEGGAAIAARVQAHATAATTPDSALPEATVAYDRIARAVRRTVALARHIAAHPARDPAHNPAATRTTARAQLIRGVEDAIHVKQRHDRDTDTGTLHAELAERLEDPELDLDLQGRPIEDVIEDICRDLGIAKQGRSYTWQRRTPNDIRHLRARAAAPPAPQAPPLHLIPGGKPGHRLE